MKTYRTFMLASVVFLLCAILLGLRAKGAGPLPGDLEFTRFLQSLLPYSGGVGALWNGLGEGLRYLPYLVLAVTLGLRRWDWALLVIIVCLPVIFFGEPLLKPLFMRPRPSAELVGVYQASKGFSFPSGTAMNSMAVVGVTLYLARLAGKSTITISVIVFSLLFLLLSNLARIHVGAHWATDIVGGWMFASVWVVLLLALHQWWLGHDSESH